MFGEGKRGLSPVIATVLLIAVAIILAIIFLIWALSFIGESAQKSGSDIENSCEKVQFVADIASGDRKIYLENRGSVPIHGVEVREIGDGEIVGAEELPGTILAGQSDSVTFDGAANGEDYLIVPILVGETSDGVRQIHICDKDYGIEVTAR